MMIFFLIIFVAVATLALDLAAKGERAQDLQNTSDAAALAGVVEYQEYLLENPLDFAGAEAAAELVVEQVMAQNGIDPAAGDIAVALDSSADGSRLRVSITDSAPDQFLPNRLFVDEVRRSAVTRSATAEFLACQNECNIIVRIGKSFGTVEARGNGDGYKPILVGQHLYAINHNSNDRNIVCIDTVTEAHCWDDGAARQAYSGGAGFFSPNPEMPHTAVVGSRIYWAATDKSNGHRLFCWETAAGLDVPCTSAVVLNSSLLRFDNRDDDNALTNFKDENRGGGTFTVRGDKVFSFTDDHRIHCWDPAINNTCSQYSNGGNLTALGEAGFPAGSPVDGNHGSSIDRIVDETTGRVYSTLHIPFAQNFDCSTPLPDPAGERVVIVNQATGRYLASDIPDSVFAAGDGASEAAQWDIENFGADTISLQSAAHGEYLDAGPELFPSTSVDRGEDDRWNAVVSGDNDAYYLNSQNDNYEAGTIIDVDGVLEEGAEFPAGVLEAEWNFYHWKCGIDPDQVNASPDYFDDGTWMHCYDTGVVSGFAGPCPGFAVSGTAGAAPGTPSPIHADATRFSGRLWFFHDPAPEPGGDAPKRGVCSSGYSSWNEPGDNNFDPDSIEVTCVEIGSGNFDSSMTNAMNGVRDLISVYTGISPGAWGDPHWNSATNRLFYPTEHDTSRIICYDFDDRGLCSERTDLTGEVPPNPEGITSTEDYGFISKGDCVFALGHTSFFWGFKASDFGEECDAQIDPAKVDRCPCGDGLRFRWGELDFGAIDLSLFDVFGVRVAEYVGDENCAESPPIFPADGSFIYPDPDDGALRIPLDEPGLVPEDATSVLVCFDVQGLDEDVIEDVGDFEIRFAQVPRLVD